MAHNRLLSKKKVKSQILQFSSFSSEVLNHSSLQNVKQRLRTTDII